MSATTAAAAAAEANKGTSKPGTKNKKCFDAMRAWLEKENYLTPDRLVGKLFARYPYTFTNVMDVWECDLLDVQAYAKFYDKHRYILSVIDVFSKFLHMIRREDKRRAFCSLGVSVHIRSPEIFESESFIGKN